MASPPVVVQPTESVRRLARLLRDKTHGGFPVVSGDTLPERRNEFRGLITRYFL